MNLISNIVGTSKWKIFKMYPKYFGIRSKPYHVYGHGKNNDFVERQTSYAEIAK